MSDKTWKEQRAEQDRADAISDAKNDAEVASKRGTVGKALTRVAKPVINAVMRNFQSPAYSEAYEETYDAEVSGKPKNEQKKMAKGGSVRGWGKARSAKKCKNY